MNTLIAVRLPEGTVIELDRVAKAEGRLSSQEIIREAVSEYLNRRKREEAVLELQTFVGSLKGKTRTLTNKERDAIVAEINQELKTKASITSRTKP